MVEKPPLTRIPPLPTMSKQAAVKEENKERQPMDLESLDPLDPRKVSLDIFELYCHEMIMSEEVPRRAYLIKKLRVSSNCKG